jgi:hypothetical protein
MTIASLAVQEAVIDALQSSVPIMAAISGVYDGPPPRAAFPYISVSDGSQSDWSTKTEKGREIRLALTVWDDGEEPARLHSLMHEVEAIIATLPRALDGWHIVSLVFLRSMVVRDAAGPWAGLIEHRVRVMAVE